MIFSSVINKNWGKKNSDAGKCYVSLGKGRPGCGTESLEKCEQQVNLLVCNIAFLGESLFWQNPSCPDLAVWLELCGKAPLSSLISEKVLKASLAKGSAVRCPSITCLFLFSNQNKFSPDVGRSVRNLNRFCCWTVLLSKPHCSDPLLSPQCVPWEAWAALGGYCGVSLLTWSGQRDVTLPWTHFELRAGFLLFHCLFAMGRWQFLSPHSSIAFGIFECGFENPDAVVHENITCVFSCNYNVRTM